jgi:hypothetical protein
MKKSVPYRKKKELSRNQWLIPAVQATLEAEIWRIMRPAHANSSQDIFFKITKAKWIGGQVQVVQCLLCKCKALSSNLSSTKIN